MSKVMEERMRLLLVRDDLEAKMRAEMNAAEPSEVVIQAINMSLVMIDEQIARLQVPAGHTTYADHTHGRHDD